MANDSILSEKRGPVGLLTINRPKTLNAIDVPTMHALDAALAAFEADDSVRAIVVTGAGERAFVAGGDIADLDSRRGLPHYEQFAEVIHRLFTRFDSCDKPTLGAINGWALGGGTELLLALDIRLVAEEAKLGLPEITLGLFPGAGGTLAPAELERLRAAQLEARRREALERARREAWWRERGAPGGPDRLAGIDA